MHKKYSSQYPGIRSWSPKKIKHKLKSAIIESDKTPVVLFSWKYYAYVIHVHYIIDVYSVYYILYNTCVFFV